MTRTDLAQRLAPRQARSRATIEHVLEVSAELLEEVGLDGFNTNLLAQRAGVGTRAIYRYFPNKFAIILAWQSGFGISSASGSGTSGRLLDHLTGEKLFARQYPGTSSRLRSDAAMLPFELQVRLSRR